MISIEAFDMRPSARRRLADREGLLPNAWGQQPWLIQVPIASDLTDADAVMWLTGLTREVHIAAS